MNDSEKNANTSPGGHSLSSSDGATQPTNTSDPHHVNESVSMPSAHVVLISQNSAKHGQHRPHMCRHRGQTLDRTADGFSAQRKRLRRAGLDYWQHLDLGDANDWDHLTEQLRPQQTSGRFFYLSRFAKHEIWEAEFQRGDVFVFGSESGGLPDHILDTEDAHALKLPTSPQIRSLNLATTAGVVLYEHMRQTRIQSG